MGIELVEAENRLCLGSRRDFRMVLVVLGGSPERSLKRQPLQDDEYGSSNVPIKNKWPKVFGIRDFPKGCGRPSKAMVSVDKVENLVGKANNVDVFEVDSVEPLKNVVESRAPQVLEDLDQSELVGVSHVELLKPLDYAGFVDLLETLEYEATELLVETLPKICFSWRRISATRDFPTGCGRSTPHVSEENCRKGIAYKGLGHEKPFEEAVRDDVKQDKEEVQGGGESTSQLNVMFSEETADKVQAQSEGDGSQLGTSSEIKSGWEDTNGKSVEPPCDSKIDVEGLEGKMGMEFMKIMEDRSLNRKVSGVFGNMNQLQGEKPIGSQVGRVIVQALMAAPNCPWRQTKRTFKSNSTSGMTRSKGKKH